MAFFNNVEDFTVGVVLQGCRIGEVGNLQLHIGGQAALAIAVITVAHGAVELPPLPGALKRLGSGLYGIRLLGGVGGNCGVWTRGLLCSERGWKEKRERKKTDISECVPRFSGHFCGYFCEHFYEHSCGHREPPMNGDKRLQSDDRSDWKWRL